MFDQVLIRPDLIERFDFFKLQILESDGKSYLLSENGIPNKGKMSDHLPIMFTKPLDKEKSCRNLIIYGQLI